MKKVTTPPRTSRPTVEPRSVILKNVSTAASNQTRGPAVIGASPADE